MDNAEDAYDRAAAILEAHQQIANGEHHPNDIPQASVQRLLTDLLHYCHERNTGVNIGSGEYLAFDHMVKGALEQFVRKAKPCLKSMNLEARSGPLPEFEAMQNRS